MQKYEFPLPPPVPPRRKRATSEGRIPSPKESTHATKTERKHRSAPLPPTAPQRSRSTRKTPSPNYSKFSCVIINQSKDNLERSLDNYSGASSTTTSVNGNNEIDHNLYDKVDKLRESLRKSKKLEIQSEDLSDSRSSRSSSPFSKSPEPNKYPPLYFTFEDYKMVMEDIPLNTPGEVILEQIEDIQTKIEETSEKLEKETGHVAEVNGKIEEISEQVISPLAENVLFENPREEICFRVTTTNRPFEKCLGEWNILNNTNNNENQDGECSSSYIFEDYMDRNNKLNKPHILKLNEKFFSDAQDENSASTEKSTTRVRFIIESPSSSTPDIDLDNDDDGTIYTDFIEKTFLNYEKRSSTQLFDVTNEEVKAFNKKVSNFIKDENDTSDSAEDEENASKSLYTLTTNQTNDSSYSEWDEDIHVFSSATFTKNEVKIDEIRPDKIIKSFAENKKFTDEVTEETSEKRTMFINSSFYSTSEEDEWGLYFEKDKVNSKTNRLNYVESIIRNNLIGVDDRDDTINDTEDIDNKDITKNSRKIDGKISPASIDPKKIPVIEISPAEEKPVPENVLRNFFLETMLNSNNLSENSRNLPAINCEVIAAHPKQDLSASSPDKQQQNTESPIAIVAVVATETEVAPKNSLGIELTESGARPKVLEKIDACSNGNNKSAEAVKGDVLNELLANFSAIKLKPVKTIVHTLYPSEESINLAKGTEKCIKEKTDDSNEIKQTADILENNEGVKDGNTSLKINLLTKSSLTSSNSNISDDNRDTSAIIQEASPTKHNENDNKATTPIVVSNDQPREAVSIIPGSVKSFVKYYEIQSEICSIAKVKDTLFKKQSERVKEKHKSKLTKTNEKSENNIKNSPSPNKKITTSAGVDEIKNLQHQQSSSMNSPKLHTQKESCLKAEPNPKCERKKSVQFDDEDIVIVPPPKRKEKEKKKVEEGEGTLSLLIGGIKTKLQRNKSSVKSPVKSSVNKVEQQNGLTLDQHRNDRGAIICNQKSAEAKSVTCSAIPGNRSFLPQSETLQSNQTIVFYCTI